MSISGVRHARYYIAALGARLARPSWRAAPLAILHGAAIAIMAFTETTPAAITLFLLTWGLLVSFWLLLLRRPMVAAALSLILIVAIVVLSSFKHDIVWLTVDFLDVMLIDFETIRFLLTIYPDLQGIVAALLVVAVVLAVLLWRFDPYRVGRRASVLGLATCCTGLIALSIAAPGDWWEVFARNNFVSKFSRSAVAAVEEILKHGMIEADAHAAGQLPVAQAMTCNPAARLPHVILVHDESSVDIRIAPNIKVPDGYGSHFRSFDGKARRLLVESYGGASWYSEFAVLTGLSSRSFGRFAYSLPRIAAGRVKRGLPLELRRCGYRTYSFYSASAAFMSAKSFQMSLGIEHFVDNREMGTMQAEPDSFYYDAAMTMLRREHGSGPLFAFVYLAANHFPFMRSWHPDLMPGWRDPGNTPEVDEYLRRQARSMQDYQAFLDRLNREFPGEPFLLIRYGDHQPAFPTFIMDLTLDKAAIARRMQAYDPRYFTTYYAVDTINYQPADLSTALETLDAPYLPLVIQQIIGLPLSSSFVEQRRIFERCSGIFYACAGGAEVRRFNRLLLDSGQLSRL
jgi:phosphoglycerol transferase MdoB-like AlkP superfamily enzyme